MPRIRLNFDDGVFTFSTELDVRFDDINVGHHLGNDRMVSLIGEARSRFLADLGLDDLGDAAAGVPGTIVADLAVTYLAEARHRDVLRIDVGISERTRVGGEIAYRVVRTSDSVVVALARTGLVFYDYAERRVVSAPAAFARPV